MSDDTCNDATNRLLALNNEATPDAIVFDGATSAPAVATSAAFTIVPDVHIPPSGQKHQTLPFSPVNMNNMANNHPINTTHEPDAPTATSTNASVRSPGSQSPTPHIH